MLNSDAKDNNLAKLTIKYIDTRHITQFQYEPRTRASKAIIAVILNCI